MTPIIGAAFQMILRSARRDFIQIAVGVALGMAIAGTLLWRDDSAPTKSSVVIRWNPWNEYHNSSGAQPVGGVQLRFKNSSVALLSVGVLGSQAPPTLQYIYWAAAASKHAYAATHSLPFYVMAKPMTTRRAAWDKLLAIKAVMAHSGAERLWCTDSDSIIMNLTISVEAFLQRVQAEKPDASIIVSKDCNGINTGSWFLRNTPWTHQHLTDAWYLNDTSVVSVSGLALRTTVSHA